MEYSLRVCWMNEANWGYTLRFMDKSVVCNVPKRVIASAHPPGFSL